MTAMMRILAILSSAGYAAAAEPLCCRHIVIEDRDGAVANIACVPGPRAPRWAREVSAETVIWPPPRKEPFFAGPVRFVLPPADQGEVFFKHNHQPALAWLANGDLLAIWYSTRGEQGTELTMLASRRRAGRDSWDPSAVFFKAAGRNMHGSALVVDDQGTLHHLNGMAPEGAKSWENLALLHRSSRDCGINFRGYGMFAALSDDDGATWPVRKLLTPGAGTFDGGAWTGSFTATPDNAEHAGYLAGTQTPDGIVHLLSSALHYQFNSAWLRQAATAQPPAR